jgi:hypothetical protein
VGRLDFFAHFRYALRQLRQSPGFAVTEFLTLTFEIGDSTAISPFSMRCCGSRASCASGSPCRYLPQPDDYASVPTMRDYQSRSTTIQSLAAYRQSSPRQRTTNAAVGHRFFEVSQGFFSTLGTRFALGKGWPITGNEQNGSSERSSAEVIESGASN